MQRTIVRFSFCSHSHCTRAEPPTCADMQTRVQEEFELKLCSHVKVGTYYTLTSVLEELKQYNIICAEAVSFRHCSVANAPESYCTTDHMIVLVTYVCGGMPHMFITTLASYIYVYTHITT